jgi:hypothetical protein
MAEQPATEAALTTEANLQMAYCRALEMASFKGDFWRGRPMSCDRP